MARDLIVYLQGEVAGTLRQEDSGRLTFTYARECLERPEARQLSLSLPLREEPFDDRQARPYFAGLLPDDVARERLARYLGVTSKNDFALLAEVGGECAGAVALFPPGVEPPPEGEGNYRFLNEAALARILRDLPRRPLRARGELRLSLAGAQDKIALLKAGDFFLPLGDRPTSHILKPAVEHFADIVPNECFCMLLAARLGLEAPTVEIGSAEGIPFLLIERYDRVPSESGQIRRLHQEDFCQALAIPPENKYQGEGGPSFAQCFRLLDACARPALDRLELLRRVLFNFLIGNADAHGKNFALLHRRSGTVLAPAYDVVCTTVYGDHTDQMAMKIGRKKRFGDVLPSDWESLARKAGLAPARVRRDLLAMAERLPVEARRLADELKSSTQAAMHSMFDRIVADVGARADAVRRSDRDS
jgi:serine/threonine-protein kinase HipA